jgi:hypothetical protein
MNLDKNTRRYYNKISLFFNTKSPLSTWVSKSIQNNFYQAVTFFELAKNIHMGILINKIITNLKNRSIFQVSILVLINILKYSLMCKNRYKSIFKKFKIKTSENNFSHIFYLIMWLIFQFQFWKNSHFEIEMMHFQAWLILWCSFWSN